MFNILKYTLIFLISINVYGSDKIFVCEKHLLKDMPEIIILDPIEMEEPEIIILDPVEMNEPTSVYSYISKKPKVKIGVIKK